MKNYLAIFISFFLTIPAYAQYAGYTRVAGNNFDSYGLRCNAPQPSAGGTGIIQNLTCGSPEGTGQYSIRAPGQGGTGRYLAVNIPATGTLPLLLYQETFTLNNTGVPTQVGVWVLPRTVSNLRLRVYAGGTTSTTLLAEQANVADSEAASSTVWKQYSSGVFTPTSSTITVKIYTDAIGDANNDPGIDTVGVYQAATLNLQKALGPSGRAQSTDQFSISISGAGTTASVNPTTGSGSNITSLAAVLSPALVGSVYTLSEAAATTVPATNLSAYTTSYACTNTLNGGQTPSGSGTSFTLTPAVGDNITCTFTNTRQQADLQITKTGPAVVAKGGTVTYTITVKNATGSATVPNAVVTDAAIGNSALYSNVTTACATGVSGNVCTGTGTGVAPPAGTLAAGYTIAASIPAGGVYAFTVTAKVN